MRERLTTFATIILISVITVSPILWFLQHQVRFLLCAFLIGVASLLSLRCLETPGFSLVIRPGLLRQLPMYLGVASSLALLVLNFLGIFGLANLLLALYVVLFVPGFVVLRIIKLRCSILENLVLSFGLSLAITGLFVTPLLHLAEGSRALIIAIGYSLFSTIPIIIERSAGNHSEKLDTHEQRGDVINVASLVTIVLLFTLICGTIYPVASYAPVDDILAHWRSSRLISRSPKVYSSTYPWFHIFESTIYVLSRPSMAVFMSVLAFLSVLLVLTFYVLANKYLKDVDPGLPIFATMIWFLFSGFGWLHYIQTTIPHRTMSRVALLWIVSDRSYWDTLFGQGPWLWLFLRPLTLGFLLLFTLLFLLKLKDLKSLRFTLIFSILTMALGLIHIPELLVFIAVLFIASVLTPQLDLRLKEAWLSTFIGLVGISAVVYTLSAQGVMVDIPYYLLIALAAVSLLGWYVASCSWGGVKIKVGQDFRKWICIIALIVFLAGLLSWLSSAQDFTVELVGSWKIPSSSFMVPWHLYPVLLGVAGLIFVLGLTNIWKVLRKNRNLVLFIFMALVALLIGRLVSFMNAYPFQMFHYYERRFVPILFASISLIVPIPILKFVRNWVKVKGVTCATLLIGLLVLAGTTSTALSIEYWNHSVYRENARVAEEDWGAINYLYQAFEEEPNSRIFTITSRSEWELGFAAPRLIVGPLADPLWTAKYPEMPLWILQGAYPAYDSPYIYLHARDMIELHDKFASTFMDCATSSIFPPIYQDSVTKVVHLPQGSIPSPNSSVALVMPYNHHEETAWAYSFINILLSLGGYNYTTLHEMDSRIQDKEVLLVPLDDSRMLESLLQKIGGRTNAKLVVFNTCGSDYFAQHFMTGDVCMHAVKLASTKCDRELLLPTAIQVPSASFTNKTQILGWYLDERCRTPLATRWNLSGIEVTYVNIYPLAQAVIDKIEINLYETFPELLEIIGLSLPKQRDYSPEDLLNLIIFREASFRGSIALESDSIIFQPNQNVSCLTLHLKEEHKQITDANGIVVDGIEHACVFGDRMDIDEGMGFYSSLRFHNSSIAIEGTNLLVELQYKNGSRLYLEGEREIMITIPDSVILLVRTPQVKVDGTALFEEAYGLQTVFDTLRASGQDVNITGHVEFKMLLSDEHSIAKNVTIEGTVKRNPPILQWDELGSIKSSIVWFIIAALIVLPLSAMNTKLHNVKIKAKIGRD